MAIKNSWSSGEVLTAADLTDTMKGVFVNAQTGTSYTFGTADGFVTLSNASGGTATIPANATAAFNTGAVVGVMNAGTAGSFTIGTAAGVTLNAVSGTTTLAPLESATLVKLGTNTWQLAKGSGAATTFGLFHKADMGACAISRTGAGTAVVKAGTYVQVGSTLVSFASDTSISMPSLTAGTDYFVYAKTNGTVEAVAATGTWPTPVASPPADSRLIGGFHYAPGGNATGRTGGNTTAGINEYSAWDLKWRPAAPDPRGMALVSNMFWSDIYLCNRDPQVKGTSRNNEPIADGETGSTTTAIVPTAFGGNGSTRYATWNCWNAAEALAAFGKQHPTYQQFAALAFGATEAASRGNDPVTTGLGTTNAGSSNADEKFTSKWGIIQATGVEWVWGADFGGGAAAASYTANTESRGSTYQMENAAIFGGAWTDSANSGSRASNWGSSPTFSYTSIGARGVCDHLVLA